MSGTDTPVDRAADSSRGSPSGDDFQDLLAECLARIEREGSEGLEAFRAEHPEFASRLGKQLDWLVDHLASRREGAPETIGPYRVLHHLGTGGMGDVYLVEQTSPFRRVVAVKVIKLGKNTDDRVRRFSAEAQALAMLNHDGIAKIFEAGSDRGLPYFAMEYVPGRSITQYCNEERLDLDARLRLFASVCRAVEYAHRQGILHRDLKPSNILVHGPREYPIAKIIDFGLAKVVAPERAARERATESRSLVGTPDYMSPEQVDASGALVVDTRADVYSLGVVLYELLTGVLPLALWQTATQDVQAMIRAIREREPSSPSVRVGEAADSSSHSPATDGLSRPRRLSRLLAGDLDSIVMKALAKSAERRYGSAAELGADIDRYRRCEPVSARPHTRRYVLGKFVRRHAFAVSAAAALLAIGTVSLVTILSYYAENEVNLERGNLFGLASYLDQLYERDGLDAPPARPERVAEMRAWLREVEALLQHRERMREVLDTPASGADATDPALWTTGQNADLALRATLAEAVGVMDAMTAPGAEIDTMRRRIEWAQKIAAMTVDAQAAGWSRVQRQMREDRDVYGGLEVKPQVGLIPLERDEDTRLQLFWYPLPGGKAPTRENGKIVMQGDTCPVFVLLPGGDVRIGSQRRNEHGERFDANRDPLEAELHTEHIEPFFASLFEFTNGQWQLIDSGRHRADPVEGLTEPDHPFGDANAEWIQHVVAAWGMTIPSAAEWEYMARGGTDTPYWCGARFESLKGNENLFDLSRNASGDKPEGACVQWDDTFPRTAPVGSFPANGFLLHDVLGNVCEIAFRDDPNGAYFELRGSSYHEGARDARATACIRWDGSPKPMVGFRPVVLLQQ